MLNQTDSIIGCLLGTAVGDALGLPCEGLSKHRQRQIYPTITSYHWTFFTKYCFLAAGNYPWIPPTFASLLRLS